MPDRALFAGNVGAARARAAATGRRILLDAAFAAFDLHADGSLHRRAMRYGPPGLARARAPETLHLVCALTRPLTLSHGATVQDFALRIPAPTPETVEPWLNALARPGTLRDARGPDEPRPWQDRLMEGHVIELRSLGLIQTPPPEAELYDIRHLHSDALRPTAGSSAPPGPLDLPAPGFTPAPGWTMEDHDPISQRFLLRGPETSARDDDAYRVSCDFRVCDSDGQIIATTGATGRGRGFAGVWARFQAGSDGAQARVNTSDGGEETMIRLPKPRRTLWSGLVPDQIKVPSSFAGDAMPGLTAAANNGWRYILDAECTLFRLHRSPSGARLIPPARRGPGPGTAGATRLLHITRLPAGRDDDTPAPVAIAFPPQSDAVCLMPWINALAPGPLRPALPGGAAFITQSLHLSDSNPSRHASIDARDLPPPDHFAAHTTAPHGNRP